MTMLRGDELIGPDVLDVESLESLDGWQLAELFQRLEWLRRRTEGALAAVVGEVDGRGVHVADGHASVTAWCRALARWSDAECRDRVRTARLIASCHEFREAVIGGVIGVAQTHALGRAFANPRCGSELVDVAEVMVDNATKLSCHEFRVVVRRWEMLADVDGAHHSADDVHDGRNASIVDVGDQIVIRAGGGLAQGGAMSEIFERFCDAEFDADWEATVAAHGEAACASLMPRTDAQRRFDAFYAIFERAAATSPAATAPLPLVNLMIDVPTLERYLRVTTDTDSTGVGAGVLDSSDLGTVDPRRQRCETTGGIPVPAADVVAALVWGQVRRVVVDSAGVVIDMGRRRRLFAGNARQAVLLQSSRCVFAGCATPIRRCQADHLTEWSRHGPTDGTNGAPVCGRHNRLKNHGYRIHRDSDGYWHSHRPDGTEIA